MHRILAILERDLRRFRRSPLLIVVSLIFPLVQLVVLGYAFGGIIKHLKVGVVDQDHGLQAVKLRAMIGGGIIFIDDKARGLHEGYLVTPITKFELILGFNLAGTVKAILAGLVLTTVGSLIAGIPHPFEPVRFARLLLAIVATSLALISMMFLLVVRITDPLVPRAIFGVLNTLLFFPSGAIYPINAFPRWMKVITVVDPFTYAVHAFKSLLLKDTGLAAIAGDLAFLLAFAAVMMVAATLLFRRTL